MKKINSDKEYKRWRRHRRVRNRVTGTTDRPRLTVFRSARHIYAQVIDDTTGVTIAAASSLRVGKVKADDKVGAKTAVASEVGKQLAEAAKAKGVQKVCFDRGGFLYHGRVAALADAARKNGLEF